MTDVFAQLDDAGISVIPNTRITLTDMMCILPWRGLVASLSWRASREFPNGATMLDHNNLVTYQQTTTHQLMALCFFIVLGQHGSMI